MANRLSRIALAAMADAVAPGARVVRVRRLRGGLTSLMHVVVLETPDGSLRRIVLRRYRPEYGHGAHEAAREFRVLQLLAGFEFPAPKPLWLDADGAVFGQAALAMSHLPGRPVIVPKDLRRWTDQLAAMLARIHALPVEAFGPLGPAHLGRELELAWDEEEIAWRFADRLVPGSIVLDTLRANRGILAKAPPAFVHHDYWPGNTLWRRGRLTGVVDWATAQTGPAWIDVGYCRLDLTLSMGRRAADVFLASYEARAGLVRHVWFWDLLSATRPMPDPSIWLDGWIDLGATHLTPRLLRNRLRRFVERGLEASSEASPH